MIGCVMDDCIISPDSSATTSLPDANAENDVDEEFATKSRIVDLLRSGMYSDFTIVCGGREFPVHQAIVSESSSYLMALCSQPFKVLSAKVG